MMRVPIFFFTIFLLLTACKNGANSANASSNAKRYQLKGKVVSVNRTAKKATIEHDAVQDYMPAMTMEFPNPSDWGWDHLLPGSQVRAELVVDNTAKDAFWLENIGIIGAPVGGPAPPSNDNFPQIGQPMPDFSLTNQDGKHISMQDFRGKALALTFIYAKCPLPDYCIRMSRNFSDIALHVKDDPALKDKIRLLSISFDPANDTPEKLRSYGIGYLGNDPKTKFDVWQLAVGKDAEVRKIADFFGLRYEVDENDKVQIRHNLRTVVVTPEGKVAKVFPGNDWTPTMLLKELQAALPAAK